MKGRRGLCVERPSLTGALLSDARGRTFTRNAPAQCAPACAPAGRGLAPGRRPRTSFFLCCSCAGVRRFDGAALLRCVALRAGRSAFCVCPRTRHACRRLLLLRALPEVESALLSACARASTAGQTWLVLHQQHQGPHRPRGKCETYRDNQRLLSSTHLCKIRHRNVLYHMRLNR